MRLSITAAISGPALCFAACLSEPALAEVIEEKDNGFVTKDEAVVSATPKETWLALISPAGWWSSEHTWSADAENLRLTPQAGGCFCEKIPEVITEDSFTLEGSVEHMRVIQAYPERALRMVGALGPLQSEPVTGVLTIVLTEVEIAEGEGQGEGMETGTRIVWEYNVGGPMRYEVPVISKAVDGVMSLQLAGLAKKLGLVEVPGDEEPEAEEKAPEPGDSEGEGVEPEGKAPAGDEAKADIKAEDTLIEGEGESKLAEPKDKGPSLEEAFQDLVDPVKDPPATKGRQP